MNWKQKWQNFFLLVISDHTIGSRQSVHVLSRTEKPVIILIALFALY